MTSIDLDAIAAEREQIRHDHLHDPPERPPSSARGLHHFALHLLRRPSGRSSSTRASSSSR